MVGAIYHPLMALDAAEQAGLEGRSWRPAVFLEWGASSGRVCFEAMVRVEFLSAPTVSERNRDCTFCIILTNYLSV